MRKKRKGSEAEGSENIPENLTSTTASRSSNFRSHFSLEDYCRLKKRCKEDAAVESTGSFKRRLAGVATAPPCGASSLVPRGRGLKRKIGCIDSSTQTGRKNNIRDDYYVSGPTIGKGKFGSVWICKSRSCGVDFACKTLQKGEETVHKEIEIMQHLSGHPGVVTLHSVYEELECFHLVMELCSEGRLIDEMVKEGRLSEQRVANIFKDLMLVVNYCHDMGVVHRDIKPENILLTADRKIKLADFGLAMRIAKGQTLSGLAGSPAYVAPEVLTGHYSEKVDIWSAGVLLYALLSGVLPFRGDSLEAIFDAIKNVKLDFHSGVWDTVSKPARDLLSRMLTRDVTARITADEVLRHPWILFYTDRSLKTLCIKSKHKNQAASPPCLVRSNSEKVDLEGTNRVNSASVRVNSSTLSPSASSVSNAEERDESDLVDVLAVAISNVRISEPKRSRICGPNSPIEQQHSSNLTANTLCRAF